MSGNFVDENLRQSPPWLVLGDCWGLEDQGKDELQPQAYVHRADCRICCFHALINKSGINTLPYACLSHAVMEAGRFSACALLQTSAAADLLSSLIDFSLDLFNLDQVILVVPVSMLRPSHIIISHGESHF